MTGREVAVVISDTEWKLDKFGSVDVAIGSSGIQPVKKGFGAKTCTGNRSLVGGQLCGFGFSGCEHGFRPNR